MAAEMVAELDDRADGTAAEMTEFNHEEATNSAEDSPEDSAQTAILEEMARPFVGRWNKLVSMTNWEKGRIIAQWRTALVESGAPTQDYSDEAWSKRIGNYTGQHVGRLRRVYERFGTLYETLDGLFWSHFHAALDWDDAEEWLTKTHQARWSVAQMRTRRSEELGLAPPVSRQPAQGGLTPYRGDEEDDDRSSAIRGERQAITAGELDDEDDRPKSRRDEDDDDRDDRRPKSSRDEADDEMIIAHAAPRTKPATSFGRLPEDLLEAVESLKLSILRHKSAKWAEVRRDDVLAALGSLAELCGDAATEDAPF